MKILFSPNDSMAPLEKEPYASLLAKLQKIRGNYDGEEIELTWSNPKSTFSDGFYLGEDQDIAQVPFISFGFADIKDDSKIFVKCRYVCGFYVDDYYNMIFDRVKNISQRLPYLYIPNTCYFDAECTISEKLNITFEMIVSDKNKVEEVCCSMISHLIAMFTLDD